MGIDADRWRIPNDFDSRAASHDAGRSRQAGIRVLSAFDLEKQIGADGATWLDQRLITPDAADLVPVARADALRIEAMLASSAHHGLTGAAVRELATEARSRMRLGTGGYRREHVRAFAQRVEVGDDAIRIMGSKDTLLRTLVAAKGGKSAGTSVPGFVPKWRCCQSNANRSPPEALGVLEVTSRARGSATRHKLPSVARGSTAGL